MEAAHVTGVGIAVWKNGKVVYLKTYGFRDTEKHLPLTPDSVLTAASLTKPAFAIMVLQLVAILMACVLGALILAAMLLRRQARAYRRNG